MIPGTAFLTEDIKNVVGSEFNNLNGKISEAEEITLVNKYPIPPAFIFTNLFAFSRSQPTINV